MIPFTRPPQYPADIPAARFAAQVHQVPVGCRVGLIGLPDDTGVRMNNGRPGAAEGPGAFRQALARYGVAQPGPRGFQFPRVYDAGDVIPDPSGDIHATHDRVSRAVSALLDLGLFPIAIGGGHDLTFPVVRAVATKHPDLFGVYFDAHLDVRDTVGSGMPFRRIVEWCGVKELHAFGINPLANSAEHVEWFGAHGGRIHPAHERGPQWSQLPGKPMFASFDLDVIDAAYAPGVSALNPAGWTPVHAEHVVLHLGRDWRCVCFDLMELNPPHDEQGRTARLAAHLFLTFLRGFAERPGPR